MELACFFSVKEQPYFDAISNFLDKKDLLPVDEGTFEEVFRLVMEQHNYQDRDTMKRVQNSDNELARLKDHRMDDAMSHRRNDEMSRLAQLCIIQNDGSTFRRNTGYEIQHKLVHIIQTQWPNNSKAPQDHVFSSLLLLYAFCQSQPLPQRPHPIKTSEQLKKLAKTKCGYLAGSELSQSCIDSVVDSIALFEEDGQLKAVDDAVRAAYVRLLTGIDSLLAREEDLLPSRTYTNASNSDDITSEMKRLLKKLLEELGVDVHSMYGGTLTVYDKCELRVVGTSVCRPQSDYIDRLCVKLLLCPNLSNSPPLWETRRDLCLQICRLYWFLYINHQHINLNNSAQRDTWCNHYQMAFSFIALLCCIQKLKDDDAQRPPLQQQILQPHPVDADDN